MYLLQLTQPRGRQSLGGSDGGVRALELRLEMADEMALSRELIASSRKLAHAPPVAAHPVGRLGALHRQVALGHRGGLDHLVGIRDVCRDTHSRLPVLRHVLRQHRLAPLGRR